MDFAADSDTAKGGGAADADAGNVLALTQKLTELSSSSAAETKALQAEIESQKQQLDTERAAAQAEIAKAKTELVDLRKTVDTLKLQNETSESAVVDAEEKNKELLAKAQQTKKKVAEQKQTAKLAAEAAALQKKQHAADVVKAQNLQQDNDAKKKDYEDRIADLKLQLQAAIAHINTLVPLADSSKSSVQKSKLNSGKKVKTKPTTRTIAATDAATKNYVDVELYSKDVTISLDITGLSDPAVVGVADGPKNSIATLLENMQSASNYQTATTAFVMATSYTGSTVSGITVDITTSPDTSGVLTKSSISVDKDNVSSSETVIQDISQSNDASGVATLSALRYIYEYTVSANTWVFVRRTLQTVT